jgi:Serine dehydrogenase proteinase
VTDAADPGSAVEAEPAQGPVPIEQPSQTPLFHTVNRDRYSRQEQIRRIQERTGRPLLCWIGEPQSEIDRYDIAPIADLLHPLEPGAVVDLFLQSPGGDIDIAEKIVLMLRKRCAGFRVIVPEFAKSAATLIAIAADSIVMGYPSELGPIDPQVSIQTMSGEWVSRPAHAFLEGLRVIKEEADESGTLSPAYFPVLQHVDPALLDYCRTAIARSEQFAKKWLTQYQCAGDHEKAAEIAANLGDVKRHLSHGAVIDHAAAGEMGLQVEYLAPDSDLWNALWRLYCDYVGAMRGAGPAQIFESSRVSLAY